MRNNSALITIAVMALGALAAGSFPRTPREPVSGERATAIPATAASTMGGEPGDVPVCQRQAGYRATRVQGAKPLPISHVIILMQENRSFDHYFGRLSTAGQPDSEPIPGDYSNLDPQGRRVTPFHLPATCVPADPPHQWDSMHAHWNGGRMDGFVREAASSQDDDGDDETAGGKYALGYYDQTDLPFYYYLANTFTIADRYFSAVMAGTWPNRQFLYAGTAQKRRAATGVLQGARTIFDNLDAAALPWAVYTDFTPRQDCIGWGPKSRGIESTRSLFEGLRTGNLPAVSFLDPAADDEHPPADVQRGENWARELFVAATASPLWPRLALFLTYDEGGGFFDHVAPPAACPPSADRAEYQRRGTRVPFVAISPWAKRHHVSHTVYDHTSILRFVEVLFDLPALTARDANADPLSDVFDFETPPRLAVPLPPPAGRGGCRGTRLLSAR